MAQGLPSRHVPKGSDRDHVTEQTIPDLGMLFVVLSLFLMLCTLLAAPLSAQSRGQVQVAARVVSLEPSRQALALATRPALAGTRAARTPLARVQWAARPTEHAERRVVSIDFLRN